MVQGGKNISIKSTLDYRNKYVHNMQIHADMQIKKGYDADMSKSFTNYIDNWN